MQKQEAEALGKEAGAVECIPMCQFVRQVELRHGEVGSTDSKYDTPENNLATSTNMQVQEDSSIGTAQHQQLMSLTG